MVKWSVDDIYDIKKDESVCNSCYSPILWVHVIWSKQLFIVICLVFFCFVHAIFRFWSLGDEVTKICLHFSRQDGQDGKKPERNHATKVTKIPKTKGQKYGMEETMAMLFWNGE